MWDSVACHGCSRGGDRWDWKPPTWSGSILNEIAMHAEANPNWLDLSAAL
jgi:hypothetical protein